MKLFPKKAENLLDKLSKTIEAEGKPFFLTLTQLDTEKTEGNLSHSTIKHKDFPLDDIIPSVDSALRSLNVSTEKHDDTVVQLPITQDDIDDFIRNPLKIAIISHFRQMPDSYSPGMATRRLIKVLTSHGHQVVAFMSEGCTADLGCELKPLVPRFKRHKGVVDEAAKSAMVEMLRRELTDFDVAITMDLYLDDCVTYREAVRQCGAPVRWLHWARSGVGRPIDFSMPNANYVYMNWTDAKKFASKIGVAPELVKVVPNDKDPEFLFDWCDEVKAVSERMRLSEKDIVQTYPMCTTRMDAKGLPIAIRTFAALKRRGYKVALIVANSNGSKRNLEITSTVEFAEALGLGDDEFNFTSRIHPNMQSAAPKKVVAELMRLSNLFVFPTTAEVSSNVLLEASMAKNLLVLNDDLPCLFDATDRKSVLSWPFTSSKSIHYSGRSDSDLDKLATMIGERLDANATDRQFRHVWRNFNRKAFYEKFLRPILYGYSA